MTNTAVWTGALLGGFAGLSYAGPRSDFDSAAPVSVVSGDQFNSTGAATVNSILHYVPNVTVGSNTGANGSAEVNLRGLGNTRDLVLVNGRRMVAGATVGYAGDATLNGLPSRMYSQIEVLGGTKFGSGPVGGAIAVGGGLTYYDGDVDTADNDELTWDLNVAATLSRDFSQSVQLHTLVRAHYGDHVGWGTTVLRPGLQHNEVFDWQTRTSLDWRLGGQALGEEGWGFSTYYWTQGFIESGGDAIDSISYAVGQEVRQNLNDQTSAYVAGEYGMRTWDRWDAYDADVISIFGGFRTETDTYSADVAVGWEERDYDDINETNDSVTAQLHYQRSLSEDTTLTLKATYGFQPLAVNEGGSDLVDPVGTLFGGRIDHLLNQRVNIFGSFNVLDVESEFSSEEVHRGIISFGVRTDLGDDLDLVGGISWVNNEEAPGDEGDFFSARLGVRRGF